jgi:hypothetical protein
MGGERKSRSGRLRPGKIITRVIVFLILGAVVNVAVAWGCALWSGSLVAKIRNARAGSDAEWRWYDANRPWPELGRSRQILQESSPEWTGLGWQQEHYWETLTTPRHLHWPNRTSSVFRTRAGWPMYCFEGARWNRFVPMTETHTETRHIHASMLPALLGLVDPDSDRVLPYRPLPSGFAINTAFYAIILWLLIPGPFLLRRHIRIKRGRCPKCGYDLRGAPPEVGPGGGCPECGWNRQPEATP